MQQCQPNMEEVIAALERLFQCAEQDTGTSRRIADFLLAVWNADEQGGWNPQDLQAIDEPLCDAMFTILCHLRPQCDYFEAWRPRFLGLIGAWRSKRRSRRS